MFVVTTDGFNGSCPRSVHETYASALTALREAENNRDRKPKILYCMQYFARNGDCIRSPFPPPGLPNGHECLRDDLQIFDTAKVDPDTLEIYRKFSCDSPEVRERIKREAATGKEDDGARASKRHKANEKPAVEKNCGVWIVEQSEPYENSSLYHLSTREKAVALVRELTNMYTRLKQGWVQKSELCWERGNETIEAYELKFDDDYVDKLKSDA